MCCSVDIDENNCREKSTNIQTDFTWAKPEAYHLEASKFCLYVRNHAGVYFLTNQKQGNFFAQIRKQRIEGTLVQNNGGLLQRGLFNFTSTTIRAISLLRKTLSEVEIANRVCRKALIESSDYFERILAGEVVDIS